ncbi:MAG: hypothetical protein IPG23_17120 [Burkholderiales bacterium]|nr:hypothetical protein [Burkholderiales bacterium]
MRLYPAPGCGIADIPRKKPDPTPNATLPYSNNLRKLFTKWVMPVYNLFDLHNPYLLTAPERTGLEPTTCLDRARLAPPYLFLLTPSVYVKPDNWYLIRQFETEGGLGSNVDEKDEYKILTRQFVILACDSSPIRMSSPTNGNACSLPHVATMARTAAVARICTGCSRQKLSLS